MSLMEQATPTTALDWALHYASVDWRVFPCDPATKQPLISGGFKSATIDPATIRRWWRQHPNAMIGVPTGSQAGVWVLDVDDRPADGKDGRSTLAALEAKHGALPPRHPSPTQLYPAGGANDHRRLV
jgi:hypothetical protein